MLGALSPSNCISHVVRPLAFRTVPKFLLTLVFTRDSLPIVLLLALQSTLAELSEALYSSSESRGWESCLALGQLLSAFGLVAGVGSRGLNGGSFCCSVLVVGPRMACINADASSESGTAFFVFLCAVVTPASPDVSCQDAKILLNIELFGRVNSTVHRLFSCHRLPASQANS